MILEVISNWCIGNLLFEKKNSNQYTSISTTKG